MAAVDLPEGTIMHLAHYRGANEALRQAELRVHPALRDAGRLFVTIDLVLQDDPSDTGKVVGSDYFCYTDEFCRNMGGISVVDGRTATRHGPLRVSQTDDTPYTSTSLLGYVRGKTYRFGAFFSDPQGSPDTVDLDLLYGGTVLDLPVVDGTPAPEQLGEAEPDEKAELVVLPVTQPPASAFADSHPLVAPVVGGSVAEGGSVVSLNADVLFDFGKAELTPQSKAAVRQAAQVLAAKADPARPVQVVGHTDSKGDPSSNLQLSQRRAGAVVAALKQTPGATGLRLSALGKGETEPAAPNSLPTGEDDPASRALNRRVELTYTPKQVAPASLAPVSPSARGEAAAGAVTVPEAAVRASAAGTTTMSAAVGPVLRRGRLSLVQVQVTPAAKSVGVDFFASARNSRDTAQWSVVTSDKTEYRAARDADQRERYLTSRVRGMNADRPFQMDMWVAALPAEVTAVDVDLGQLGTAKGVPVR